MGYMKNSDDDGRVGGTFEDFNAGHIVGKFEYGKRDRSENDKDSEVYREFEEESLDMSGNDTGEIVEDVTNKGVGVDD